LTIHIPRWLLIALAGVLVVGLVGAGAYLLGKSSGDDETSAPSPEVTDTEAETSPPLCDEQAAKEAVVESEFEAAVRDLGAVQPGTPLFKQFGYVFNKLICRDLTGDGAEEMVIQLACCTASSPTPWAIFSASDDGTWELAFHRDLINAGLSVEGDEIVEKQPALAAGDPSCCPSTYRFGRVTWDGAEFAFTSDDASPDRGIKVSTQGVTRLGDFRPEVQSPLEAAEIFGPPSLVSPNDELCLNEWRDLGLLINFANLGGADPCGVDGAVGSIELTGLLAEQAGWETDEGVRLGMSVDELREIYPDAEQQSIAGLGRVTVLIEGPTLIGEGGTYPVLSTKETGGEVSEMQLSVGAAGD
jgi:hypothetical protein